MKSGTNSTTMMDNPKSLGEFLLDAGMKGVELEKRRFNKELITFIAGNMYIDAIGKMLEMGVNKKAMNKKSLKQVANACWYRAKILVDQSAEFFQKLEE